MWGMNWRGYRDSVIKSTKRNTQRTKTLHTQGQEKGRGRGELTKGEIKLSNGNNEKKGHK